MSRFLSFAFGFGILGSFSMTWIAPKIISLLFTPPVSFGTNCEPAASWATNKLVTSQFVGLIGGMILGTAFVLYRRSKNKAAEDGTANPARQAAV